MRNNSIQHLVQPLAQSLKQAQFVLMDQDLAEQRGRVIGTHVVYDERDGLIEGELANRGLDPGDPPTLAAENPRRTDTTRLPSGSFAGSDS
jgi:hypothetical protein